jgi:hypothetical protein
MLETVTAQPAAPNLADQLERDRLEHRRRRLSMVIAALEDRRRERDMTPLPLIHALQGFREELRETEQRLAALAG